MNTSEIIKLSIIVCVAIWFIYKQIKPRITGRIKLNNSKLSFYSINDGNQHELIYVPDYDQQWFEQLDGKYSWDNFNDYDNRFWEYMYQFFDTVPKIAKSKIRSEADLFKDCTRGQKIFWSILAFTGDADNGGVHQFFFNKPEFAFSVLESFKELKIEPIASDYEKCLNEFLSNSENYSKQRSIFQNTNLDWKTRAKSFSDGHADMQSAKNIEAYFYNKEFKIELYRTVVEYIDNHLDQYVRK